MDCQAIFRDGWDVPSLRSNDPAQRTAGHAQGINFLHDLAIFFKRWGMMRFHTRINDKRAAASPMFEFLKAVNSVNIMGRIGTRKRDPKKISDIFGNETAVVAKNNEGNPFERIDEFIKLRE